MASLPQIFTGFFHELQRQSMVPLRACIHQYSRHAAALAKKASPVAYGGHEAVIIAPLFIARSPSQPGAESAFICFKLAPIFDL